MTDEVHPTPQACREAWDRIARTPDGAAAYVYLQRTLMQVPALGTHDSALQDLAGARRFAAHLIGLMAKGVFESGGRTGITGSTIGPGGREQPLVVPNPQPVRTGRERNPGGRRITADTRVPGYDHPDDEA